MRILMIHITQSSGDLNQKGCSQGREGPKGNIRIGNNRQNTGRKLQFMI